MGRVHTFMTVLVISVCAWVIHTVSGAIFPPLADAVLSITSSNPESFGAQKVTGDIEKAMAIWVPMIMIIGTWGWAFIREFRRQRVAALSR